MFVNVGGMRAARVALAPSPRFPGPVEFQMNLTICALRCFSGQFSFQMN